MNRMMESQPKGWLSFVLIARETNTDGTDETDNEMSDVSNLDTEFFRSEIIVNVNYQRNTGTGPCFINEHERIEARGRCESICLFLLYDLTDVVGLRSTLSRGN